MIPLQMHSTAFVRWSEITLGEANMNTQKNAYLAVGYACNEKCRCCPLVHKDSRTRLIPFARIHTELDAMSALGVTDVTISGGEPTIHPDFFRILEACIQKNIAVHILSNGEKFADKTFSDTFSGIASRGQVSVTTTFHSHLPQQHEYENQTKGSFTRSYCGIRYLDSLGVNVAIKHCITNNNYRDLPEYVQWVLDSFSENAEIQLWGIDLCGISVELARELFAPYKSIGKYISAALDRFEAHDSPCRRILTINNLPLCMCDAYYWKHFSPPEADNYIEHMQRGRKMDAISGPASKHCLRCKFRSWCQGVYYSNFDVFGDDIVCPPEQETEIAACTPSVAVYTDNAIERTFLSPYTQIRLTPGGLRFYNSLTEGAVAVRIKTADMPPLINALRCGIDNDDLIAMLCAFGVHGAEVLNEFILKGIVE